MRLIKSFMATPGSLEEKINNWLEIEEAKDHQEFSLINVSIAYLENGFIYALVVYELK